MVFMLNLLLDPLVRAEELWGEELRGFGLPGWAMPKFFGSLPKGGRFGDFECVAARWLEGARLFGYQGCVPRVNSTVVLFTWVMPGGLGDWAAQLATAAILRKGLPDLKIELVTLVEATESRFLRSHDFPNHIIIYKNEEPAHFSNALLKKMSEASLILQIPTHYPHFKLLMDGIRRVSIGQIPVTASIGEYGFIDSEWFHPESGNICMGVHPLERGILLHTEVSAVDALSVAPFYFAYLGSERGYAIYLHALLTHNKGTLSDITLVVCNLLPLLSALKNGDFSGYQLKEIIVHDHEHNTVITLHETGKRLTIEAKHGLSSADVQKLMVSAEDFVGCRGDRSFSEVVTLEKFFFYDPLNHSLPFLHDLKALASHYLLPYPSLSTYIQLLKDNTTPPKILGQIIGESLSDPTLLIGMRKLLYLLRTDFLFNPTLINYVKSKICEYYDPSLKEKEDLFFKEFVQGNHSLQELLCKKN